MGLIQETRALVRALRNEIGPSDFLDRAGTKFRVPRDIGLRLDFPRAVTQPMHKVIYALWREGEQCYCNLRILTGLSENDIRPALRELVESGRVRRCAAPTLHDTDDDEEMHRFSLASR